MSTSVINKMYPCKTGKHNWINSISAARCCDGYHQELRDIKDNNYESGGEIYYNDRDFRGMKKVWIRNI